MTNDDKREVYDVQFCWACKGQWGMMKTYKEKVFNLTNPPRLIPNTTSAEVGTRPYRSWASHTTSHTGSNFYMKLFLERPTLTLSAITKQMKRPRRTASRSDPPTQSCWNVPRHVIPWGMIRLPPVYHQQWMILSDVGVNHVLKTPLFNLTKQTVDLIRHHHLGISSQHLQIDIQTCESLLHMAL